MADDQQQQQPPSPAGTEPPAGQQPPPPATAEGVPPGPVPYERFKEVNDALKKLQAQMAKFEADKKAAADKEAREKGEWEKLANQREAELKAERLKLTRLEIAAKKGIPVDLAGRLQGDTPEALEKDADALIAFLKPATGPGVPPAGKGGAAKPLDLSSMTAAQIRELAKGKSIDEILAASQ